MHVREKITLAASFDGLKWVDRRGGKVSRTDKGGKESVREKAWAVAW